MSEKIILTECPRDAMQGINEFIPTNLKSEYINSILSCGFDVVDFGSFVSSKAVPQMSDTKLVYKNLELPTDSQLLAIVANLRGAEEAATFDEIKFLGYPFSISETFQMRNTNSSIDKSLSKVEELLDLCLVARKELQIYISMAFGNPYNDPWSPELAAEYTEKLVGIGVKHISLADTTGVSTPATITPMFDTLIKEFPTIEFGAHLHSRPERTLDKIQAAFDGGCRKFDSAILGYGGCPMAEDHLVGNISTELLLQFIENNDLETNIDFDAFKETLALASAIFGKYA